MLILDGITASYGNNVIFDNLSLDLSSDDFVVITGPSGCGKTTLLRIIAGLMKPDKGRVITDMKLSFMFQEPRLFPWLCALDNVNAVLSDNKSTYKQAEQILLSVGITNYNQYPFEQSGGMQQRTALARALAYGSGILLLDEPFSALDTENKLEMIEVIRKDGRKAVVVTHDMAVASHADRIINL